MFKREDEGPLDPRDRVAVDLLAAAIPGLVAVYRFGSSATGTSLPGSDLDLAILGGGPLDPVARFDLQEQLASALRTDVDLVDLRAASTVMASQVITNGVVLHETDVTARHLFESFVYGRYARLNEERRAILERIAREGTVYGG